MSRRMDDIVRRQSVDRQEDSSLFSRYDAQHAKDKARRMRAS